MIEIGMNNIIKNYGFKNVLDGLSLEISTGDRVGIVGRNGSGKTTLFRLITGEENPNSGTVSVRRGASVGYLEQIPVLSDSDETAEDILSASFADVYRLEKKMRSLEQEMAVLSDSALDRVMREYARVQAEYTALDGYSVEEEKAKIVQGFGLEEFLRRPFRALSGGQKTIVKLAALVLRSPDVLLLDEPTNHLDIRTLTWFEGFVAKYRGTVVIISHDRWFLDRVTNKTIMLSRGTCVKYNGNYSFSVAERERQLLIEFAHYKTQQKKIEAMKAAIKRYRTWAAQSDNEDLYRKAAELEKRLEKLELIEKPELEKKKLPISFSGGRTGKEVLIIDELTLDIGALRLFEAASFAVYDREKVCLLGDNGTGKTTLIRAVLGEGELSVSGKIKLGPSVRQGYIPQEIRFADDNMTLLEAFRSEHICSEGAARGILAKYYFYGDDVFKRVSALSGGEKVLLKLAVLIQNEVNFLILDEPTNHIDIETREMLEQALSDYGGAMLFVSHDRYFIDKLADRVSVIEQKKIENYC